MTDALVQFLRARLDEVQEDTERGYLSAPEDPSFEGWDKRTVAGLPPLVARMVLREVAAKRLMLGEALASRHHVSFDQYETCPRATEADGLDAAQLVDLTDLNDEQRQETGREPTCMESCGRDARVHRTLELLAMPYSDHPDYAQALAADQA